MAKPSRKKATRKTAPKSRPKGRIKAAGSARAKASAKSSARRVKAKSTKSAKKSALKTAKPAAARVARKPAAKKSASSTTQYPPLAAYLTVSNAEAALDFYARAFGARARMKMPSEDGQRLMHAEFEFNGGVVMMSDDFPEWSGGRTPEKFGGTPVAVHVTLDEPGEVDALVEQAAMHGAKIEMEPQDAMWGDRFATISDPFGHRWSISAPLPKPTDPQ
jgi:PhnB protein